MPDQIKPFVAYIVPERFCVVGPDGAVHDVTADLLSKAADGSEQMPQGDLVFSGPIAPAETDYDGEVMGSLTKGLEKFCKLGGIVDFGHRYETTGHPKWIIGKGEPFRGPDGRDWLKVTLRKGSDMAREAWKLVLDRIGGFSVFGSGTRRNGVVTPTEIRSITYDPRPKGFGNYVIPGVPSGSVAEVCKALASPGGWVDADTLNLDALFGFRKDDFDDRLRAVERHIQKSLAVRQPPRRTPTNPLHKSLTTGSGPVMDGQTGGSALRAQMIAGACPICGRRNKPDARRCSECGHVRKAYEGFDKLKNELSRRPGVRDPAALAAAIGRKKYGGAQFDHAAHAHETLECANCGTANDKGRHACRVCGDPIQRPRR